MNTKLVILLLLIVPAIAFAQEDYKTISKEDSAKYYWGGEFYDVVEFAEPTKYKKPKNVIYLIGDGMGIAQVYAGMTANQGKLYMSTMKNIGFQTTYSGDNFITDSGAAGTALATGVKTYNGAIGVDMDTVSVQNIREVFEANGMATGVVSTSSITHATPASFVAHQPKRSMYEAIAADFLKTDIDVFIGGGYNHFTKREDGEDLTIDLKNKGYQIATTLDEAGKVKKGKLAGLLAPEHIQQQRTGREDMLKEATDIALEILDNDKDGFFLMIEGSQIDWGGHQNDTEYIITEVLDFDRAVGEALKFAAKDKETLVVVTADHETGGMTINGGDLKTGKVVGAYTWGNHTAVITPVFAFGPGADQFRGFYDNTDIPKKIKQLLAD